MRPERTVQEEVEERLREEAMRLKQKEEDQLDTVGCLRGRYKGRKGESTPQTVVPLDYGWGESVARSLRMLRLVAVMADPSQYGREATPGLSGGKESTQVRQPTCLIALMRSDLRMSEMAVSHTHLRIEG